MPYSILIVEDDLTFATMLKTWLGKKGFLVDTAGNSCLLYTSDAADE